MKPDEQLLLFYSSTLAHTLSLAHSLPVSLHSLFFSVAEYIWANCLLLIEALTGFSALLLLRARTLQRFSAAPLLNMH